MRIRYTRFAPFARSTLLFLLCGTALAQENAGQTSPSTGDKPVLPSGTIALAVGDAKVSCYLAHPKGEGPWPGLILVHEWWGLNDWVKGQADRFAREGYCALAVDLYRGERATDAEMAHQLMRGLADERAMADLKAAFDHLSKQDFTKGKPIGVIGWCMGGGFALKLAVEEPRLACTVVCYGRPVLDVEQLKKIKGPLLGIWGAEDRGIDVESFKKALEKAGTRADHHVYPGAGHAFLNETNERGYHKEQAEKAWKEIDAFLARELKKAQPAAGAG